MFIIVSRLTSKTKVLRCRHISPPTITAIVSANVTSSYSPSPTPRPWQQSSQAQADSCLLLEGGGSSLVWQTTLVTHSLSATGGKGWCSLALCCHLNHNKKARKLYSKSQGGDQKGVRGYLLLQYCYSLCIFVLIFMFIIHGKKGRFFILYFKKLKVSSLGQVGIYQRRSYVIPSLFIT